jgi:deoxycytidylate deaminase
MSNIHDSTAYPELVFGIAGPIGVDIPAICASLTDALRSVRYDSEIIHLTEEMMSYRTRRRIARPAEKDFYTEVNFKIKYANALCEEFADASTLARVSMRSIANRRRKLTGANKRLPATSTAYIIRQLKRPTEVSLLRRVYGKQFVLVSAYGSLEKRLELLEEKLKHSLPPSSTAADISRRARELTAIDAIEEGNDYGQRLRETFQLADVFIDGLSKQEMDQKLDRFIQAFFGRTDIAPSKQEYGMYAAKSASFRSSDLSRQVGAAIFTDDGELITQGCNEVPKAMGGTYWDSEEPDYRDIRLGYDPNDILKADILRDLLDRLSTHQLLSNKAKKLGPLDDMIKKLTHRRKPGTKEQDGALTHSLIMDVTEYGRVVHAEMCAICDAARLGRSLKGSTLFCTTFPCHNCTKHILAAGIKRVVYMEPYPKSKAKDLHQNEIEIEKETPGHVAFIPFLGVSPFRYRDIFQKPTKRKRDDGTAKRWLADSEKPLIDVTFDAYIDLELEEYGSLFYEIKPKSKKFKSNGKAPRPTNHG